MHYLERKDRIISHYTVCKSKIRNKAALLQALEDMGFTKGMIQVHDKAVALEGYQGDKRKDTAEIILPRRYVGGASNDIGFKLQEDGSYAAIISAYDSKSNQAKKTKYTQTGSYNTDWLDKLTQRYAYHNIKGELSVQGFTIESETNENGEIFLEVGTQYY